MIRPAITALLLSASPAFAAPLTFTVDPKTSHTFDADIGFDGLDFEYRVTRAGGAITVGTQFGEAVRLSVRGEGEYSRYDFDLDGEEFAPTGDYLRLGVRPTLSVFLSENFGFFGGATIEAAAERDSGFSNAYTYGSFFGANYKLANGVWIGGGVGYQTQLEDTPYFYPLVTAFWQITPELSLIADGVGGRLNYKIDDTWTVFADGHYEFRNYRTGDDGTLRDQGFTLLAGVRYQTAETLSLTVAGGATIARDLRVTAAGTEFIDESPDPAAVVTASLEWTF